MTSVRADQGLLRARTAVVVTFATSGIAFASFASRTPAVREALGLTTAQLGLLLLCMSAGSLAGLPLSGPIVYRSWKTSSPGCRETQPPASEHEDAGPLTGMIGRHRGRWSTAWDGHRSSCSA